MRKIDLLRTSMPGGIKDSSLIATRLQPRVVHFEDYHVLEPVQSLIDTINDERSKTLPGE